MDNKLAKIRGRFYSVREGSIVWHIISNPDQVRSFMLELVFTGLFVGAILLLLRIA